MKATDISKKLVMENNLSGEELFALIKSDDGELWEFIRDSAENLTLEHFGRAVYIRGLIEFTNYCKNNCLYCGIRRDNKSARRYRLSDDEIISCCDEGYSLGFRTFVLQGGEDSYFNDERLCAIIAKIKGKYPDCAVTLSVGEKSGESYKKLFEAGADRYLLRHETADEKHYSLLHPSELSFKNRMECLKLIKAAGFQTGCGFMIGSPYQTDESIVKDLMFIKSFNPEMVGIGPFIPHKSTPFASFSAGSAELTIKLISVIRLLLPRVLLPSTTALGTISEGFRDDGIRAGANVIMPNLSPLAVRDKYTLYDGKIIGKSEAAENLEELKKRMEKIGRTVVTDRGDYK